MIQLLAMVGLALGLFSVSALAETYRYEFSGILESRLLEDPSRMDGAMLSGYFEFEDPLRADYEPACACFSGGEARSEFFANRSRFAITQRPDGAADWVFDSTVDDFSGRIGRATLTNAVIPPDSNLKGSDRVEIESFFELSNGEVVFADFGVDLGSQFWTGAFLPMTPIDGGDLSRYLSLEVDFLPGRGLYGLNPETAAFAAYSLDTVIPLPATVYMLAGALVVVGVALRGRSLSGALTDS